VVWQADYDAFGNARIETGHDIFQPFRLAGHYKDEETGLHYSAARYYNPTLGRFLSLDPLFLEGGSDNFYAYCNGDPINSIDPTGELIFCAILIGAAVGAAIGAAIGAGVEYYRQKQTGDEVDGNKIAKAALIGGAIGAIGGGVGAAVEGAVAAGAAGTVLAKSAMATMATVGFLEGAASSVAEQCAEAALTDKAVPPH
jgi:RHS repeat-associated protein